MSSGDTRRFWYDGGLSSRPNVSGSLLSNVFILCPKLFFLNADCKTYCAAVSLPRYDWIERFVFQHSSSKVFLDVRLCLFSPDVYFSQLRWGRASCLKKINELTHWHELLSALLPNPFCYPLCIQERAAVSVAEKSMAEKCSNIWDPTQTHAYKKKPPRPRKTLIA